MYFGSWDEGLFILSMIFFVMHKLLSLIRAHLFIFTFVSFLLETDPKNIAMNYVLHIFLQKFYSI